MDNLEKETLDNHTKEIGRLREDFRKFFLVIEPLIPEIAETKTLQRMLRKREASRKRNGAEQMV